MLNNAMLWVQWRKPTFMGIIYLARLNSMAHNDQYVNLIVNKQLTVHQLFPVSRFVSKTWKESKLNVTYENFSEDFLLLNETNLMRIKWLKEEKLRKERERERVFGIEKVYHNSIDGSGVYFKTKVNLKRYTNCLETFEKVFCIFFFSVIMVDLVWTTPFHMASNITCSNRLYNRTEWKLMNGGTPTENKEPVTLFPN